MTGGVMGIKAFTELAALAPYRDPGEVLGGGGGAASSPRTGGRPTPNGILQLYRAHLAAAPRPPFPGAAREVGLCLGPP